MVPVKFPISLSIPEDSASDSLVVELIWGETNASSDNHKAILKLIPMLAWCNHIQEELVKESDVTDDGWPLKLSFQKTHKLYKNLNPENAQIVQKI